MRRPRLLLDELTTSTSRAASVAVLLSTERPWTVVLTSHDATTITHCTRLVTLDGGRFVEGTTADGGRA